MEKHTAAIRLITFGGLHAQGANGELERLLAQHSRAALLVYLAVERRVSRESLIATFWPESDAENARHALRQSLYQLRKVLGGDWVESHAHELVVGADVEADAHSFTQAVERGEAETAVELYRGSFLDGVHLVDLRSWESWVDARRAQYSRAFRKACREVLEFKRAAGDFEGAIAAAEQWIAVDPADDEAQHRLIEALALAGERAEAIRQYETYARMVEPDGLHPRDETAVLIERLRADASPLPTLRDPAPSPPLSAPSIHEPRPASVPLSEGANPRRWSRLLAPIVMIVAAALLTWMMRWRPIALETPPSPPTIVVLPFTVRGTTDVHYLADGIVNLLGTALDGAGSIRPADARATFGAVSALRDTSLGAPQGRRVAAQLGARMFVLGDAVEAGNRLQIEAAVYDVDTDCGQRAECAAAPRTKAVVSGSVDSVFSLVDRLAARLLGGLGDPAAERLLRTASVTTTSLPAFKEFLRGEQDMRAGRFERAADDYLAAIALDSTFAVAHYRLALAREWAPLPGNVEAAAAAARHGARLSARDRMLLDAFGQWRAGNALQADRDYRAILARYPDDVDAWFQLGEIQFHHGPLLGRAMDTSEEAWRKVLSYEPGNLFAITHLARIAAVGRRPALLDSMLTPFETEQRPADRRLDELLILRAVAKGDTATAGQLAREVARGERFSVWRVAAFLTAFNPDAGMMGELLRELRRVHTNPAFRADLLWYESMLELARGRIAQAESARARAAESELGVPANQRRIGFDAVTEWYAATLPLPHADSTISRVRQRARSSQDRDGNAFTSELEAGISVQLEPVRQYSLGMLSLRLRDTTSAAEAASRLRQLATSRRATGLTRDLDRGLRAHIAWRMNQSDRALALLDSLEHRDTQGDIAVTPFASRANERFLRAEILAATGRDGEALAWLESLGEGSVTEIPLRALAHLRRAELHERGGNHARALEHYSRLAELWAHADWRFQPLLSRARERLARPGLQKY